MIAPLTFEQALDIMRSRTDRAWLEEFLAQPDGQAIIHAMADIAVEVDAKDAKDASSLFIVPHSRQVAPPASGAEYATTTLAIALRKQPKVVVPLVMQAGTRVQTPDGHTYLTDEALSFAPGEVGVAKAVTATALLPGHPGVIPVGELTQFTPIANGISGIGTALTLANAGGGSLRALKFVTNTAVPHPFKSEMIGMLLEVVSVDDVTKAGDVGRVVPIEKMNDGSSYTASAAPENAAAWAVRVSITTDSRYSIWAVGTFGFEWRIADWGEYFDVTNTEAVVGGRGDMLGELAAARGRPRAAGEEDEHVRARLARAPAGPFPIPLLQKAVTALVPWGGGLPDVRVYEMREPRPSALDPYARNFPAAMGFIADVHSVDMPSPETPNGMAIKLDESPLDANPGLAVCLTGVQPWVVFVRWDAPGGMSAGNVATIRRLLFSACKAAVAPGVHIKLYEPGQWGYPLWASSSLLPTR